MFWILSFVLMALFAVYQRTTGPTYPVSGSVEINAQKIKYTLPRSHGGDGGEWVKITVPDKTVTGTITLKRFKSADEWKTVGLIREGDVLKAELPHQEPAGKVIYHIALAGKDGNKQFLSEQPVVIRFKGDVPIYFILPHVIFIFAAMWFSTRTGLEAIAKGANTYKLAMWTTIFFFISGLILGPIVQKYAFGAYWTGWPFGHDLTDNKTLLALIMWIIALWRIKKNGSTVWTLVAAVVLFVIFLIPHSVLGSEIDYTKLPK